MDSLEKDIVLAVTVARKAEVFLAALGATGDGLGKKIASIKSRISALSPRLLGELQLFNSARNDLVHSKPSTARLPEPFALLASKLSVQIDYYAQQQGITLPPAASATPEVPQAPVPQAVDAAQTAAHFGGTKNQNGSFSSQIDRSPSTFAELEILPPDKASSEGTGGIVKFGMRPPPRSWIVDGTDGLGDFETIQEAIDAARDGDSIRILPACYEGALKIEKNIVLEGQGSPDQTIITSLGDILYIAGFGAKISGCTFRADTPRAFGIVAANLSLVVISQCAFDIVEGTGIIALDGSSLRIENCSMNHCQHGVRIAGASVEIFKSQFNQNTNAILLQTESSAKIYNNNFLKNGSAIEAQAGSYSEISGNRFIGGSAAIVPDRDAEGVVQSNEFSDLSFDAAVFYPQEWSKIHHNFNTYK